jgi:uncharacterized repeat protein (TIGR03803 family)
MTALQLAGVAMMFLVVTAITSPAQTLTTLLNFNGPNGENPQSTLIQGPDGNLYGTTYSGGANNNSVCEYNYFTGCGTVFKVTPTGVLTVIYSFCPQDYCPDGHAPEAGLVLGRDGNFYGTTSSGGVTNPPCDYTGCGTVFKITPDGTFTTLYSFCSLPQCADGVFSSASLVQASDGNLYGITNGGGTSDPAGGTVFRITPSGALTTIYSFCSRSDCADGDVPYGGLTQGADGNLYGTTLSGGTNNNGTIFKITLNGSLTTLYTFCSQVYCPDGSQPYAGLVEGADGNFYGTTSSGGNYGDCNVGGCGTIFRITPTGTLTTLHAFDNTDGDNPYAGVVQGTDGNFYGATASGGSSNNCESQTCGTIFKITPSGSLTTLHSFDRTDGAWLLGGLMQASDGNFYGTTSQGGPNCGYGGCGTLFSWSPHPSSTLTVLTTAPNPSDLEQTVTLTATVTAQNGDIPTGIVTFESNGVEIGSTSLNNSGVAVLTDSQLSPGSYNLTATYLGTPLMTGSTSNAVVQLVNPWRASTTTVTGAPNPSTVGQLVSMTAIVGPVGPPTPTGTVSFTFNGDPISGCTAIPLSSSLSAICTDSTLPVGMDAVAATYSGDSNYGASSGWLTQIVNPVPVALQYVSIAPCRLVDTRPHNGGSGPIPGGTAESFVVPQLGGCNIPTTAAAFSLNVTAVPPGPLGYLTLWPTGENRPIVSTLNSLDGRTKANAAIVPAGTNGAVSVYVSDSSNVLLDIDGYFTTTGVQTEQFYALAPCRVIDTRNADGPLAGPFLTGQVERDFPLLESTCIPPSTNVLAYSLNFTVVPHPSGQQLGYLTVWPQGDAKPLVSTLNNPTATIVANAAIVAAGTSSGIAVYPDEDTDLVVDINGYFAAPGGQNGLSLYVVAPCRVLDTRKVGNGQPFSGELTVNVAYSPCAPPLTAQGYVFNATVVPSPNLSYLTLWPDGEGQPIVSTLNAADGWITSNMAIVPNMDGKIDAYAAGMTQLILDISSYFAP